jgi:hypothetical protein
MRPALIVPVCAALITLTAAPDVRACGDKLVALGGGVSFARIIERHPVGNIVLLIAPESQHNGTEHARQLQAVLERAGHSVHVLRDPLEFRSVLEALAPDLVLSSWADVSDTLQNERQTSASPAVLRLRYEDAPTRGRSASADQKGCVVDAGKRKGKHVVKAVSDLLKLRDKGLPTGCDRIY